MQFLQVSQTTRRRLLIEEILLMLLRMGLIAVMVLALAAPFAVSPLFARMGQRPNRDVVLVFDGSASMAYAGTGQSTQDAAQEWALAFLGELSAGDSVAVLQAKQQVVPVLADPTHDLERAREAVRKVPEPRGGCDWPRAVRAAFDILERGQRPERDIVLLGDGQRRGWADEDSLFRWELLAQQLRDRPGPRPRVWVVNLAPNRPGDPPNWSPAPLRASRAVASAGQQVTFRTALMLHGQSEYQPPYRLRLEIDGKPAGDLKAPAAAKLERGQVPLSFSHRFPAAGSHLVSLIVEPDPPPEQRPAGYSLKDHLPADNRQDFALEVVSALPVLLVDGDSRAGPKQRGTDFLRDALAPARDPTPAVLARVVSVAAFDPPQLARALGPEPGSKPRVLVLADVPRLSAEQQEAVSRFLAEGGGVLVTLGERADARFYNDELYRQGQGWLPARLEEVAGELAQPDRAARPQPTSFYHPALELFRGAEVGGLGDARFPRWWKVTAPGRGSPAVPVGLLTGNDPFVVERPFRGGRVLLCAVPLDNSWRTNLTDLPAFAPLAHELIYYLAGARSAEFNLQPGEPLRYRPPGPNPVARATLHLPGGETKALTADQGRFTYEATREVGVYRLEPAGARLVYFVVQPDPREADLTAATAADREQVATHVPLTYADDRAEMVAALTSPAADLELWWWFMLGVIALLGGEVWLTRRIVRNR